MSEPTRGEGVSLVEYADRRHAGRGSCWTCELPPEIRAELDAAKRDRPTLGVTTVARWLTAEHGFPAGEIPVGSIAHHFRYEHHHQERS